VARICSRRTRVAQRPCALPNGMVRPLPPSPLQAGVNQE
jgi:hypothetical protein